MQKKLDDLLDEFKTKIQTLSSPSDILNLKSHYLGKTGPVTEIFKTLKALSVEEKRAIGPLVNKVKEEIVELSDKKISEFEYSMALEKLSEEKIDISLRDSLFIKGAKHGGLHPVTLVQRELEEIFFSMGFEIADGPHIENEFYNFEALNIAKDHPARDMQDTFWFHTEDQEKRYLLRTHTSTIQVRAMQKKKAPFRIIAPGKVFRCERTDASHEMVFHQLEGLLVDKDITVGNLIYFLKTALREIFKKEVEVRLRPGFFPFVEPGFELDIKCLICQGKGCSVCKQTGWVELLPCGMVHPNVLKAGGIDPSEYNGFAFGLGLDRLVMMRYGIDDIRYIHSGDLRFLSQFRAY